VGLQRDPDTGRVNRVRVLFQNGMTMDPRCYGAQYQPAWKVASEVWRGGVEELLHDTMQAGYSGGRGRMGW
jgi:hypothetical protein